MRKALVMCTIALAGCGSSGSHTVSAPTVNATQTTAPANPVARAAQQECETYRALHYREARALRIIRRSRTGQSVATALEACQAAYQ